MSRGMVPGSSRATIAAPAPYPIRWTVQHGWTRARRRSPDVPSRSPCRLGNPTVHHRSTVGRATMSTRWPSTKSSFKEPHPHHEVPSAALGPGLPWPLLARASPSRAVRISCRRDSGRAATGTRGGRAECAGRRRPLVDCPRARTLRDSICVFADMICVLVERDRTIPEGSLRCQKLPFAPKTPASASAVPAAISDIHSAPRRRDLKAAPDLGHLGTGPGRTRRSDRTGPRSSSRVGVTASTQRSR